jgi:hypothetical protein
MSSGGSSDLLVDEAVGEDCWPKFTRIWPAASGEEKAFVADRSETVQAEEEEGNNDPEKISAAIAEFLACYYYNRNIQPNRVHSGDTASRVEAKSVEYTCRRSFSIKGRRRCQGKLCLCRARVEYAQLPQLDVDAGRIGIRIGIFLREVGSDLDVFFWCCVLYRLELRGIKKRRRQIGWHHVN